METIELRPDLREQVEEAARLESRSVQEIVNEALAEYLQTQDRAVIDREQKAFERMHAELLASHRDQWVAIHDGKLVDSAENISTLNARVRKNFGRKPILMTPVTDSPVRILHWRTPSTGRRID
jgi:predicted transcriptional regulator